MNEPKINITVMPGAQMNGYVKEQHNYFGTVQQVTKEEARQTFFADSEEAEVVDDAEGGRNPLHDKIAACFERGLLEVSEPSRFYFLLLAMWARRLLASKEIPAFVRMLCKAYPSVVGTGCTEQTIVDALYNMNRKAGRPFDTYVKDQGSMIAYIEMMYPERKGGKRRKECEEVVKIATNLHLALNEA